MTTREFTARLSAFASANEAKASTTNKGPVRTIVKNSQPFKHAAKAEDDPNNIGETTVTPPSVGFSIDENGNINTSIDPGKVEYNFYEPQTTSEETTTQPQEYEIVQRSYFSMGDEVVYQRIWENTWNESAPSSWSENIIINSDGSMSTHNNGTDPTVWTSYDSGRTWTSSP